MKAKFKLALVSIGCVLFVGCAGVSKPTATVLKATGDSGVSVQIRASRDGTQISDAHISAPSTIEFPGGDLDIVCIQEGKPGKLQVRIFRDRVAHGIGGVGEPGSVIKIGVRGGNVSIGTMSRGAAESEKL